MFLIVIRKMLNNKWLFLCLLVGLIIGIAMMSSIPIYTRGILQKMLIKDMENYQIERHTFPGSITINTRLHSMGRVLAKYKDVNNYIRNTIEKMFVVPVIEDVERITMDILRTRPVIQQQVNQKSYSCKVETLSGIEEKVNIVAGRMFSDEKADGVYEVIVSEGAAKELDLLIDREYIIAEHTFAGLVSKEEEIFRVKVVGVFAQKDPQDVYWFRNIREFNKSFFMNYDLYKKDFVDTEFDLVTDATINYALDYHQISIYNIDELLDSFNYFKAWEKRTKNRVTFTIPIFDILNGYEEKAERLRFTLWMLEVPILIMLSPRFNPYSSSKERLTSTAVGEWLMRLRYCII